MEKKKREEERGGEEENEIGWDRHPLAAAGAARLLNGQVSPCYSRQERVRSTIATRREGAKMH